MALEKTREFLRFEQVLEDRIKGFSDFFHKAGIRIGLHR